MAESHSSEESVQRRKLNKLLAQYEAGQKNGQKVDRQALLKAFPEFAAELKACFLSESQREGNAFASTRLEQDLVSASPVETLDSCLRQSDTASEFSARMFGRYQLIRPLGEGAMGSVFLALDTTLDRRVALKMPKGIVRETEEFLVRFTREARAAAGLKHSNICRVYDAGEVNGIAFITMDFIDGVPLSKLIGSPSLQSVETVLKIACVIADAVHHAHQSGVIHRDLKPGNILMDDALNPYVTDFGLARRIVPSEATRVTQDGLLVGTPAYMSPEQIRGDQEKVGVCSDIYSFGVVLFEMLVGQLPFNGSLPELLAKVLRDHPPVPGRLRPELSESVDDVVLKMLKKDPAHRFRSMDEVLTALNQLADKWNKSGVSKEHSGAPDSGISSYEIRKNHIELMLKKGQYTTAIQDLETLAGESSPRAGEFANWAKQRLPVVRREAKAMNPAGLAAMLQTAQQLFQKHDYAGCIQLLEEIPTLRRSEAMEQLLEKATNREVEAERLLEEIRDKERRQNPEGLELLVKKLLRIKPGNSYAKKLLQALQTYGKTPISRRHYRFERGRLQPMPEPSLMKQWGVLGLLTGLLVFLSVYYYTIIYLKSGEQTLTVEVDDEWLKSQGGQLTLSVDGTDHTISVASANEEPMSIVVTLGEHEFAVRHGETVVHNPRDFEIHKDGRVVLQITQTDMRLVTSSERTSARVRSNNDLSKPAGKSGNGGIGDLPNDFQTGALGGMARSSTANDGWTYLFDGEQAIGWSTLGPFQIRDRLLIAVDSRGMAISQHQYDDFEIEAEWKLSSGANGGIYYREDATMQNRGNEYQLIDPAHPGIRSPKHKTGAYYGVAAPAANVERPVGEWNATRIVARGNSIEHWLNGQLVVEYIQGSEEWKRLLSEDPSNSSTPSLGVRPAGHFLLQSQTGELAFRTIRLKGQIRSEGGTTGDLVATSAGRLLDLPDSAHSFDSDIFREIHNARPDELLAWSEKLPKQFCPLWTSARANSHEPRFDAVAVILPGLLDWKLSIVDAESESFEQPGLKGRHPMTIVSFRDNGKNRSLCLVSDSRTPWQFWNGAESFLQGKITENLKNKTNMRGREWPSVPVFVSSHHAARSGGYYLLTMPRPPILYGQLSTRLNANSLESTLQSGRAEQRVPGLISFDQFVNNEPTFLTVIRNAVDEAREGANSDSSWCSSIGITMAEYERLIPMVAQAGGKPRSTFSYIWNNTLFYGVIWGGISPDQLQTLQNGGIAASKLPAGSLSAPAKKITEATPAIAPFDATTAQQLQQAWADHLKLPVEYTNSIGMKFRLIPPGQFTIGSSREQIEAAKPPLYSYYEEARIARADSEAPQQLITLTRPFYLGCTEVTQSQFALVVGNNPSEYGPNGASAERVAGIDRSNAPVETVTWISTGEFCERLTNHEGLTSAYRSTPQMISQTGGGGYRLPTEAEWEFACRAGTTTLFWCGDDEASLGAVAWFGAIRDENMPHDTAKLKPNPFGLFDMHGNVWEWVHDAWRPDTYTLMHDTGAVDPRCDLGVENRRVVRGGDYFMSSAEQRSACRDAYPLDNAWHDVGFRVALSVDAVRQSLLNRPNGD